MLRHYNESSDRYFVAGKVMRLCSAVYTGRSHLGSAPVQRTEYVQRGRFEGSEILTYPLFSSAQGQWQYQLDEANFTVNGRTEEKQLLFRSEIHSCLGTLCLF
jgi:hypothetical protein